jgi:hypothetical protein
MRDSHLRQGPDNLHVRFGRGSRYRWLVPVQGVFSQRRTHHPMLSPWGHELLTVRLPGVSVLGPKRRMPSP